MPRRRSGRARGRPQGHDQCRLQKDALAAAFQILGIGLRKQTWDRRGQPTVHARLANRILDETAAFNLGKVSDSLTLIVGEPVNARGEVKASIASQGDEYTRRRMTSKQVTYDQSEAAFVSKSIALLCQTLLATDPWIISVGLDDLKQLGWPDFALERVVRVCFAAQELNEYSQKCPPALAAVLADIS